MIIGQTVFAKDGTPQTYYTPWANAGGNWATMVMDLMNVSDATIQVWAQTKNEEEDDSAASPAAREWGMPSATSSVDLHNWEAGVSLAHASDPGLLQLVRFRVVVTGNGSEGTTGFVNFRILNPSWQTH